MVVSEVFENGEHPRTQATPSISSYHQPGPRSKAPASRAHHALPYRVVYGIDQQLVCGTAGFALCWFGYWDSQVVLACASSLYAVS